jgi:MFS family permease
MIAEDPAFDEKNFSIFRYPPVLYLWIARVATAIAYQMQAVAVGWQIYELTSSPMQLGLVGLAMFIPGVCLLLVVGHAVDRYDRKMLVRLAQGVMALAIGCLAFATATGVVSPELILACVFTLGAGRAFEATTIQTMAPSIVPPVVLPQTMAGLSSAFQAATVVGPALGGALLIVGATFAYAVCCGLLLISSLFISLIRMRRTPPSREPVTLKTAFAGINFVRKNPIVLGAMSLDMFAVILGGATALLPIFARDIFHVGTWGLGLMRAAPAIGALTVSALLVRWPVRTRLGPTMFGAIIVFGLATIVFGLSTSFSLSMIALFLIGASDMVSVVIRQPLIQLETPDAMRGRVSAVNSLFIGTSNQIGEFRSGVTADWFGTVPSVLIGGIGTIIVVLIWIKAFPELFRVRTFEQRYK